MTPASKVTVIRVPGRGAVPPRDMRFHEVPWRGSGRERPPPPQAVSARTKRPSIPAAAILPVPMVPALISVYGKDEAQARGVPAVPSGRTRSNGEAHLRRRSAAERRRLEAQVGQRLTLPMHCQWLLSLLPIPCSRGFG